MKQAKNQDVFAVRPSGKDVPEARQLRKQAGDWLKQRRADAGLSQADLAAKLGLKYYTFISQVENGFSRVRMLAAAAACSSDTGSASDRP